MVRIPHLICVTSRALRLGGGSGRLREVMPVGAVDELRARYTAFAELWLVELSGRAQTMIKYFWQPNVT